MLDHFFLSEGEKNKCFDRNFIFILIEFVFVLSSDSFLWFLREFITN